MSSNADRVIVRHAKPGSKAGWHHVSGEIPPDVAVQWLALVDERQVYQTDLVHEAITVLLKQESRKGRERREVAGRRDSDLTAAGSAP